MNEKKANTEQQVEWNLSGPLIAEIAGLLALASAHNLKGKYQKQFITLRAVRMRFIQNLEKDERKNLYDTESEFASNMSKSKMTAEEIRCMHDGSHDSRAKDRTLAWNTAMTSLEEYNTLIMDLLDKYGFLLNRKTDSSKIM